MENVGEDCFMVLSISEARVSNKKNFVISAHVTLFRGISYRSFEQSHYAPTVAMNLPSRTQNMSTILCSQDCLGDP